MNDSTNFRPESLTVDGTLADRVRTILEQRIKGGEFPPHSHLPSEPVLAERFRVSRTVIREAVSRLKSEGLVETRRGSGTIVLEPNLATPFRIDVDVRDSAAAVLRVIELRRGIEAEMAALAAERRTATQLAQIRKALAAIDHATQAGGDGVAEDLALHTAISQATGNSLYTSLLNFLTQFIQAAIRVTRTNEAQRDDLAQHTRSEHAQLVDAIARKDVAAARAAALEHMENTAKRVREADPSFWTGQAGEIAQRLARTAQDVATSASRPTRGKKKAAPQS
ncbi:FadR/GntR family transcriptional regulator [Aromatoleum diolicum]|uniref:GntR family transcriptional regulator n=1 Tax=Aromatoleum diolicum TaxID=75796 RepID=A0ABX1Q903_9RHOO|nr:FadR/GntR family transcriptional regulator [Aromatoleum diolicum]NMG73615.1 GntR family transcriptional regulator [Aromatoleum diolicum]